MSASPQAIGQAISPSTLCVESDSVIPICQDLIRRPESFREYFEAIRAGAVRGSVHSEGGKIDTSEKREEEIAMGVRRLVQICVVDPDPLLPAKVATLHSGVPFVTDETDDELKMLLDIRDMLEAHNRLRAETLNKSDVEAGVERPRRLAPLRLRDLAIRIIVLATFEKG